MKINIKYRIKIKINFLMIKKMKRKSVNNY